MATRRQVLGWGLSGGLALLAGSLGLVGCAPAYRPVPGGTRRLTRQGFRVLEAAVEAILPDGPGLAPVAPLDLPRRIDATMADLAATTPALPADFSQLLALLDDVPLLSATVTPFSAHDAAGRARILARWERSPLPIERQGFQGLKRLVAAVAYMQPATWPEMGYPGPWIGRIDVGTGLDNQGPCPIFNPNVLATFQGA